MSKAASVAVCVLFVGVGQSARAQSTPSPLNQPSPSASTALAAEDWRQTATGIVDHVCPGNSAIGQSVTPFDAWEKGKELSDAGDYVDAITWHCRAAKDGSARAAYALGELYKTGYSLPSTTRGTITTSHSAPSDKAVAFFWYKQAAQSGYTRAIDMVATFELWGEELFKGSGVTKNIDEAIRLAELSAAKGDTSAMTGLAKIYLNGFGDGDHPIPRDLSKAKRYFEDAASRRLKFQAICDDPEILAVMSKQLSQVDERRIMKTKVIEVYDDSELVCRATLALPNNGDGDDDSRPEKAAPDNVLGGLFSPGLVNNWNFTIYHISKDEPIDLRPANNDEDYSLIRRYTLGQQIEVNANELGPYVNALNKQLKK